MSTFLDTQEVVLLQMGGGTYMSTNPLIGIISLHKKNLSNNVVYRFQLTG